MEKPKLQTCALTRDICEKNPWPELAQYGKIVFCIWEGEPVFITNEDLDNNIDIQCPVCRKHYFEGRKII